MTKATLEQQAQRVDADVERMQLPLRLLREAVAESANSLDLYTFRSLNRELVRLRRQQRRLITRWIRTYRKLENL